MKREGTSDARGFSFCHACGPARHGGTRAASERTIGRIARECQSSASVRSRKRAPVLPIIATWVIQACCLISFGCAAPAERTGALARSGGAQVGRVVGAGFEHVVYTRNQNDDNPVLHIYFSGDGTPFIHSTRIAADPTPRDPLELRLMLEDPAPSVFIGRPCYQGLARAPGCDATLWTVARYSDAVVASMTAAVGRVLEGSQATRVTLIGYSGGGVLAMLVAQRVSRVDTVVTIGANLDIDAWTQLHGYSRLTLSLNPATAPEWRVSLRQVHLVGAADRNVPPWIAEGFARTRPGVEVRVFPEFDHRCCWVDTWPGLLGTFPP